jgi:hypothetical protein
MKNEGRSKPASLVNLPADPPGALHPHAALKSNLMQNGVKKFLNKPLKNWSSPFFIIFEETFHSITL